MRLLSYLIPLFTIVITDPYRGLQYDRANVYIITKSYKPVTLTFTEPEEQPYYLEDTYQEEVYESAAIGQDWPESDELEYEHNYGPYFEPQSLYNTSPSTEVHYFMKLFDYYGK
jgi:hypothetical protein